MNLDLTPDDGARATLLERVRQHPCEFSPGFDEWLDRNFVIWRAFEREALRVAERRLHYSARTIAEVIRHHTALAEQGGHFKIGNDTVPDMARLFALLHPEREDLFEFRKRTNTASRAAA